MPRLRLTFLYHLGPDVTGGCARPAGDLGRNNKFQLLCFFGP
jgi:hypothetical protein